MIGTILKTTNVAILNEVNERRRIMKRKTKLIERLLRHIRSIFIIKKEKINGTRTV